MGEGENTRTRRRRGNVGMGGVGHAYSSIEGGQRLMGMGWGTC